jgi:hypothetical protein
MIGGLNQNSTADDVVKAIKSAELAVSIARDFASSNRIDHVCAFCSSFAHAIMISWAMTTMIFEPLNVF